MINGVLTDVRLTVGPVGPRTHPVVISPVPECIIGIDILRNWQNSHIGSLNCRVRAIMVGKAKWKPLELPLPKKIVNQKQYRIPGGIAEITAPITYAVVIGIPITRITESRTPIAYTAVSRASVACAALTHAPIPSISTTILMVPSILSHSLVFLSLSFIYLLNSNSFFNNTQ